MEYFLKHKIIIFRTVGALMLLLGFVIHFWVVPKEGVSEVDIAAASIELQNYDYSLQLSYKMSSMFLTRSLLDYI